MLILVKHRKVYRTLNVRKHVTSTMILSLFYYFSINSIPISFVSSMIFLQMDEATSKVAMDSLNNFTKVNFGPPFYQIYH